MSVLAEHPKISIELVLSDGYINIVDEGIDIAVRYGRLADSTLRARSLGKFNESCVRLLYILISTGNLILLMI